MNLENSWFLPEAPRQFRELLEPVFEKLQWVHERYIEREVYPDKSQNDCAFWYKERSQVGLLAAAIWLADGIALEEYGTDKTDKTREWKRRRGRADLYFKIKHKRFYCEAKHCSVTIKKEAKAFERETKALSKVCKSLKDEPIDTGRCKTDHALGICFVTVRCKTKNSELEGGICKLKKSLTTNCTAFMWIEDKQKRFCDQKGRYLYPGFFLAVCKLK